MEYLHLFETEAEFQQEYNGQNYHQPWVSYTVETGEVYYNKPDQFNGHRYVDLGLPSGTLWAKCNVGANSQTDIGGHYAWGEIIEKTGDNAYAWNWSDYRFGTMNAITKYNNTDGKTTLDLDDDVAHVVMGGEWVMPTSAQYQELIDNSTWELYTLNEKNGVLFTSTINGNTIFFPFSGTIEDGELDGENSVFMLWTSNLAINSKVSGVDFGYSGRTPQIAGMDPDSMSLYRSVGCSVRGVVNTIPLESPE